jgi:hypothetical protein
MNEQDDNFSGLTQEEFEHVVAIAASPDFHDLAAEDFFAALAAIEEEEPCETLELTATVKDGQIIFLQPAPLYAQGNEIRLGDKRVVIKLLPEEMGNAA